MPWLLGRVPGGYWDDIAHRRQFLRWLGQRCGFRTPADWYSIRQRHFKMNRGGGLLAHAYGFSVFRAVQELFPDAEWLPWKFGGVPQRFWQNEQNRRWYLRWLGLELGYRQPGDWYSVRKRDFYRHHGGGLLANYFADSPQQALHELYPDFDFKPWLFHSVPQNFWREPMHRLEFIDWLAAQLNVTSPEDWERVRSEDFHAHGGGGLLTFYYGGSIRRALQDVHRTSHCMPS